MLFCQSFCIHCSQVTQGQIYICPNNNVLIWWVILLFPTTLHGFECKFYFYSLRSELVLRNPAWGSWKLSPDSLVEKNGCSSTVVISYCLAFPFWSVKILHLLWNLLQISSIPGNESVMKRTFSLVEWHLDYFDITNCIFWQSGPSTWWTFVHFDVPLAGRAKLLQRGGWSEAKVENWTDTMFV